MMELTTVSKSAGRAYGAVLFTRPFKIDSIQVLQNVYEQSGGGKHFAYLPFEIGKKLLWLQNHPILYQKLHNWPGFHLLQNSEAQYIVLEMPPSCKRKSDEYGTGVWADVKTLQALEGMLGDDRLIFSSIETVKTGGNQPARYKLNYFQIFEISEREATCPFCKSKMKVEHTWLAGREPLSPDKCPKCHAKIIAFEAGDELPEIQKNQKWQGIGEGSWLLFQSG